MYQYGPTRLQRKWEDGKRSMENPSLARRPETQMIVLLDGGMDGRMATRGRRDDHHYAPLEYKENLGGTFATEVIHEQRGSLPNMSTIYWGLNFAKRHGFQAELLLSEDPFLETTRERRTGCSQENLSQPSFLPRDLDLRS